MLKKNVGLKILSFLIAGLFFLYVNSETNSSVISFFVPVEVHNLPPEKIILLPTIRQAKVTIRGPSFLVSRVASSAPVFRVRLEQEVDNREEVLLSESLMTLPPGIEVVGIDPSRLQLTFDDLVTRTVKVAVPILGKTNGSTPVESITIHPQTIEITGPITELEGISRVETEPIDIRDIDKNLTQEMKIKLPGQFTKASTDTVSITVLIRKIEDREAEKKL